jgi:PucR C-terminal helix-turn-helix domain
VSRAPTAKPKVVRLRITASTSAGVTSRTLTPPGSRPQHLCDDQGDPLFVEATNPATRDDGATPVTSSQPTLEQLVDELQRRADSILDEHSQRMRDHLPDWVQTDPVSLQRIRELSAEAIGTENRWFRAEQLPDRCPELDARSAHELARLGQPPDMLLAGHRIAHRCHWEAWLDLVEERVADPDRRRELLERGSRFMFDYVERVGQLIEEEYDRERERIGRSAGERRVKLVRELLAGEEVDSSDVDWPLEHHHVGILAWADGGDDAIRELATAIRRPALVIETGVEASWFGWASSARSLNRREERTIAGFRPRRGRLAVGLEALGADGFRLTHRQARRAGWVAWYTDSPVTRFEDVALEALAIEDAESARATAACVLRGFDDESVRSRRLRSTLLAYFESNHNAAATAAAIGVHQQTVANRIRAVEAELGAAVSSRRAELELALRLRRCFEKPPSLQAGLQNEGYLP